MQGGTQHRRGSADFAGTLQQVNRVEYRRTVITLVTPGLLSADRADSLYIAVRQVALILLTVALERRLLVQMAVIQQLKEQLLHHTVVMLLIGPGV